MKINTATLITKSDSGIKILMKQCMTIYDNGMQLLLCNYAAPCEKKNCTSYEAFDKCEMPTMTSHPKSDLLHNMKSPFAHFSEGSTT